MKPTVLLYLYSFLFYLALPYVFFHLWRKSLRQPDYRKRWAERFGFYPFTLPRSIWLHAASVGETLAAVPLIKAIQAQYPNLPVVVTTMTPTGSKSVKRLLGESVLHTYIPYDLPHAVQRFLKAMQPTMVILMETELWPNLLNACHAKNIPVCLLNARLSEKSANGYKKIRSLSQAMLQKISLIAAHGEKDAQRFIELGAAKEKVLVTGNLKFDLQFPRDLWQRSEELRALLGNNRFVWIAASTHDKEEEMILAAHQILRRKALNALLILVPRHPDRFHLVAELSLRYFPTVRRSSLQKCSEKTAVYLCDTMGELLIHYAAADVAFVGGSLIPHGGHNFLEPAALGKPILTGPNLFNFAEISELFLSANALKKIFDAESLASELYSLYHAQEKRELMGQQALKIVKENRGALDRQVKLVNQMLTRLCS